MSAVMRLFVAGCCLLAVSATAPTAVAQDVLSLGSAAWTTLRDRLDDFVEEGQVAGIVTLAIAPGRSMQHSLGHADLEANRSMADDTVFAIASMTKPITATGLMILVDDGKVSLDDPVSKYIPEFKDVKLKSGSAPKREITVRDAVTHTSGLGGDQRLEGSLEESAKRIATRPLEFEPGTKWQYGPGLTIVGRVVEVASGKPYEEFLAERIFQPLGMKDTTFRLSEEQQARLAQVYKKGANGTGLQPVDHWVHDPAEARKRGPNPSGGLFSTAPDMVRFYQMVLAGGELDGKRIVSEQSVKEMTRVQTGDLATGFTPGNGWGLGWCVVREPQGVTEMLSPGTFGHGGLFGTQGWIDPEREMIFVLLIQRSDLPNADASEMRREFQRLAVEALGGKQ